MTCWRRWSAGLAAVQLAMLDRIAAQRRQEVLRLTRRLFKAEIEGGHVSAARHERLRRRRRMLAILSRAVCVQELKVRS
jgi:hypothetical protein